MTATWKQDDVFPIIARIITDTHASAQSFVTHDEVVQRLLADGEAAPIIEEAHREQKDQNRSREWFAHNMVAWFSERITVGQSNWDGSFDRTKVDGKWAYKPEENTT